MIQTKFTIKPLQMPLFYTAEKRLENLILGLIHIGVINIHFPLLILNLILKKFLNIH